MSTAEPFRGAGAPSGGSAAAQIAKLVANEAASVGVHQ
jgi:hypothetical protein